MNLTPIMNPVNLTPIMNPYLAARTEPRMPEITKGHSDNREMPWSRRAPSAVLAGRGIGGHQRRAGHDRSHVELRTVAGARRDGVSAVDSSDAAIPVYRKVRRMCLARVTFTAASAGRLRELFAVRLTMDTSTSQGPLSQGTRKMAAHREHRARGTWPDGRSAVASPRSYPPAESSTRHFRRFNMPRPIR
jgi:hypothetical protein